MKSSLKRGFWEGVVTAAAGAGILALVPSQVDEIPGLETDMSPSFIPVVVGVGLVAVGIVLAAGCASRGDGKDRTVVGKSEGLRILVAALLLIAYALIFPLLGFVATSAVFIGVFSFIFGQRHPAKLAALMIVIPVLVWVLFELVFVIPLPHGFVF